MADFSLLQVSSLDKVFLRLDTPLTEVSKASVMKSDRYSYQIVYEGTDENIGYAPFAEFEIKSEIKDYLKVYRVENIPSAFPIYTDLPKDGYITDQPGLFPDLLAPADDSRLRIAPKSKNALWITANIPSDAKSGKYDIEVTVKCEDVEKSVKFCLEIINCALPQYPFKYTQWLHSDCIANFYKVPVFSEKYWSLVENFVKMAAYTGINMILTPLFTPPLDTVVGGERTTVQLVDVVKEGNQYKFDFANFKRWINMCRDCGIKYFEMSHLFTQWGAEHAPKIIADVNGEKKKIFGWETDLADGEYKEFLKQFLPRLTDVLKEMEIDKSTYFHISDEPVTQHLESYKTARKMVEPYIGDIPILDALSEITFFKDGLTEIPVPAIDHIQPFLENRPKEMWTYYCCGQNRDVTNRFFAMPSSRNRIAGTQFYKYGIDGFLQWGYNFYNSQLSVRHIDPFMISDADFGFPSGDAYSVYPGEGGALESLRAEVFANGLSDMRAYKLLESLTDRQTVLNLIEENGEITLTEYPLDASYLLDLREKVNAMIAEKIGL